MKTCDWCGAPMTTQRADAVCCSVRCRQASQAADCDASSEVLDDASRLDPSGDRNTTGVNP